MSLAVGLLVLLAGCVPRGGQTELWLTQMRGMTLAEAIQRFGPPWQCGRAEDVQVCEWLRGEAHSVVTRINGVTYVDEVPPPLARLVFMEGRLTSWTLWGRWE